MQSSRHQARTQSEYETSQRWEGELLFSNVGTASHDIPPQKEVRQTEQGASVSTVNDTTRADTPSHRADALST